MLTDDDILAVLEASDAPDFSSDDEERDKNYEPSDSTDNEGEEEADIERNVGAVLPELGHEENNEPSSSRRPIWRRKSFCQPIIDMPVAEEVVSRKIVDYAVDTPTPLEYFAKYFDNVFFENAANCTNRYEFANAGGMLKTTTKEIKNFFGMHIAMGCIHFPRIRMYC
ncbi:uncharacterized protein LOC120781654 isoform X1 [Bactrocera tryoni]|uniref:uncharacterized protein LOC120781654 isoform X1 n=1 Tax=Bactrocera tryoni TaxID=59916 RepID=UPI001A96963D|nr:uncharacterized protein LOC120781654 isoform X1 [Bactrocera tryoni]